MNKPDGLSDRADPARRRLLRGSFSAPAVLTLTSGSALAAQSATCLARVVASDGQDGSTAGLANSTSLDSLMRVRLRKRTSNNVHFVAKSDLGQPVATTLWPDGTAWKRFGVDPGNLTRYNKLYGDDEMGAIPSNSQTDLYVALRFDVHGNIVGMGLSGTGSVVSGSCWTSTLTMQP